VWVGPGLNISELATEFRARVNPIGDLKCSDSGTCGREWLVRKPWDIDKHGMDTLVCFPFKIIEPANSYQVRQKPNAEIIVINSQLLLRHVHW